MKHWEWRDERAGLSVSWSGDINSTNSEILEDLDGFEHQDVKWQVPCSACRWLEVGRASGERNSHPAGVGGDGAISEWWLKCSSWSIAAGRTANEIQAGDGRGCVSSGSMLAWCQPMKGKQGKLGGNPALLMLSLKERTCQEGFNSWVSQ